jgi:DNA-binding PadR family transcriptional regulator
MANKNISLGESEHVVLLSIMHLEDNAYGVTIRQQLKEVINRDVGLGALYSTIERLEKKDL